MRAGSRYVKIVEWSEEDPEPTCGRDYANKMLQIV